MRILHVTDCYSAGVSRAIDEIALATPLHEHFLLRSGPDQPNDVYVGHGRLAGSPLGKVRTITRYAASIEAQIIFAHSSFAGFYTRITAKNVPVIYQPHCFAFHDVNRPAWLRGMFFLIEKALAKRTAAFLTLNNKERADAQRFAARALVKEAYNRPHIVTAESHVISSQLADVGKYIVMVGRLTAQKNPAFFAQVADLVGQHRDDIRFIWIGDGEQGLRTDLADSNVEVTGWLNQRALRATIGAASIYLHSADYEGFPISVLDAAVLRIPIIVRQIPCFEGQGLTSIGTAKEASQLILNLLQDPQKMEPLRMRGDALLRRMLPANFGRVYDETFKQVAEREVLS